MNTDILYRRDEGVYSFRVAGICVHDGKLLLQHFPPDPGYAFPGGHVAFGEISTVTLVREFFEETGAEISVGELKWVGELFFPRGNKRCHQTCFYYMVSLKDPCLIPTEGVFMGKERMEGKDFSMEFHWLPLDEACKSELYPSNAAELLTRLNGGTEHFIYEEY